MPDPSRNLSVTADLKFKQADWVKKMQATCYSIIKMFIYSLTLCESKIISSASSNSRLNQAIWLTEKLYRPHDYPIIIDQDISELWQMYQWHQKTFTTIKLHTAQKLKLSIKDFLSKCDQSSQIGHIYWRNI